MSLPALAIPAFISGLFRPLAALWRFLTADPARMAFVLLIALCGFLAWRLSSVDADRDEWRGKTKAMIAAAKAVSDADARADAAGTAKAADTKKGIDDANERAREAARGSDDPLRSGFDSLRKEGARGRD